MKYAMTLPALMMLSLTAVPSGAQRSASEVTIVGEMRNVMRNGQLQASIRLDTITRKAHLYGLGPLEYLRGEVLVINGRSYQSKVVSDTAMRVEETFDIKAPFFGYANIAGWKQAALPDSVRTIPQLERHLNTIAASPGRPFMFRLEGTVTAATVHVVNLPEGSKVSSPEEAHRGQRNYKLANEAVEVVGFFSRNHQAVFTHHDTYLHMHLITADHRKMGHLDALQFESGAMRLYLPE